MSDHHYEEEQVDALKRWWKENGQSTIVAVVLAVGGTVGWQQYQGYSAGQAANASDLYAGMMGRLQDPDKTDTDAAAELAQQLKSDYSGTEYAKFAAMQLAAIAATDGDYDSAEQELRWALSAGDANDEMGKLIQLRLAKVLAAKGDEAGAMKILESDGGAYAPAYGEAKGDIHLAAGRIAQALAAYESAQALKLDAGEAPGLLDTKVLSLRSRLAEPAVATEEVAEPVVEAPAVEETPEDSAPEESTS